jgi:DNA invertase Pin-like site-specific DNA recombinase
MSTKAAIYARISSDPTERKVGVTRQLDDGRAIAEQLGWTVLDTYVDNDRSAKDGKHRPDFERLLTDVDAGLVDAVVAWDNDRLARDAGDLERLIGLARTRGLRFATRHGEQSLAAAHGQLTARIKTAVAAYEVGQMGERLQRAFRDRAERGLSHGFCAFGWERRYTHDPSGRVVSVDEVLSPQPSSVMRDAARRLLSGESLRSIAAGLNAAGVATPQQSSRRKPDSDATWNSTILRQLLLRQRNAGLRVHRGEVVGRGAWQPLWDEATQQRISAVLSDPSRRTSIGNGRAKHLLSGIARCGRCADGGRIVTIPSQHGRRVYVCSGCYRIRRRVEPVDDWVTGHVLALLASPQAVEMLTGPDDEAAAAAAGEVTRLRERLDDAAASYAAGDIDTRQLAVVTSRLRPDLDRAERRVRASAAAPDLLDLARPNIAAVWDGLPLDRQRQAIRALLTVTILPTVRGAGQFRKEHVRVRRLSEDRPIVGSPV